MSRPTTASRLGHPAHGQPAARADARGDAKDLENQADIDGPLVDYKAKGHQVELVGKEKVEGTDAWKLKVTLKSGDVRYVYLDADSYLEISNESQAHDPRQRGRARDHDRRLQGGGRRCSWPHSIQSGAKGRPEKQTITFETIELNPAIDDARFKMPAAKPAEAPKQD